MKNPLFAESLATEAKQGTDNIQSLTSRTERYSEAKKRALQMSAYCNDQQDVKMSNKLAGCGNYLVFHHYYTVDKVRLHAAQFCKKHLLCPLCAIRRGSKAVAAYMQKFEAVTQQHPTLKPYLVTLTVKNGDDLQERHSHLRKSNKKMMQARRECLSLGRKHVEFAKAVGGVFSIELTNRGKGWHPHTHMIWLCYTEPDARKLSQEWHDITGDSFIVDVSPIDDMASGFVEVLKYALKFSDLSLQDNYYAYEVLSGQRLMDSFGILRGVEIPDELTDEPLDGLPYVELFYKYLSGSGYSLHSVQNSSDFRGE